jgi:hypothetical protein
VYWNGDGRIKKITFHVVGQQRDCHVAFGLGGTGVSGGLLI